MQGILLGFDGRPEEGKVTKFKARFCPKLLKNYGGLSCQHVAWSSWELRVACHANVFAVVFAACNS